MSHFSLCLHLLMVNGLDTPIEGTQMEASDPLLCVNLTKCSSTEQSILQDRGLNHQQIHWFNTMKTVRGVVLNIINPLNFKITWAAF